jgi:gamma-glutamyltranspeptidase / glutathione hydrolase
MKILTLLFLAASLQAQDRSHARSMTITKAGIVATSQTLASQAGAAVLARGGSAVDAAIASNAVLGVVEPMMCGIGGDLFAIHADGKSGKLTGINASGFSPKGLSIAYLKSKGHYSIPFGGIHTANVPGAVAGWEAMHQKFGKLPWKDLFAPAIYYAEKGFPVTELIAWDWDNSITKLRADENAAKVYLINGRAPREGEVFKNPQLGAAYRLIAGGGAKAFYGPGPLRASILKTSKRLEGTFVAADFEEYKPEWVEPIATEYRGWKVFQLPPNGQGIGTLEMLNIMSSFPLNTMQQDSAEAMHIKIEAQKLSFQDLRRYNADPRVVKVPTEGMLSKAYAAERAKLISAEKANCNTKPGDPGSVSTAKVGHTIYMSAVDRDGNVVSWIQSISDIWGSGVVVDDYGFHLHDRAAAFSFETDSPNALAPRKRPYHTIIPGYMEKDGYRIGYGIMRGMNQAQAQAQFASHVADHGMNLQAALEAPRFTKMTLGGCDVRIESRVPEEAREKLEKMGHNLAVMGAYSGMMGGGQAVAFDSKTGVKYGASSPRKDGAAIPEAEPYWTVVK